jgi:predicted RNA-binding protein associated with RNAse of E/G family
MRFAAGRTVLYRNFSGDELSAVRPCRVISDDDRGLLLWLSRGTAVIVLRTPDNKGIRDGTFAEWVAVEHHPVESSWQGPGLLKFIPTDVDHSVWFFRDEQDRFNEWYVNLEERAVRWDDGAIAGVDVIDQDLDVVVHRDRSWEWKDEDEFAERLALPEHYWVPDEAAVWAEGRKVIKLAESGDFPFDGTWTDFHPDPSWPIPTAVPPGWDRPHARRR